MESYLRLLVVMAVFMGVLPGALLGNFWHIFAIGFHSCVLTVLIFLMIRYK